MLCFERIFITLALILSSIETGEILFPTHVAVQQRFCEVS
jgi:hypothetical protein